MDPARFADLHLHTFYSDSTLSPEDLIKEVSSAGLSAISIVDHDTVSGIEHAFEAAESQAIEVLSGIELTCEYKAKEIHVLGYLIDYKNKALLEKLEFLKKNRVERAYKILDKLRNMGVKLDAQKVFDIAKHGTVGRLHIARAMLSAGLIGSTAEAFRKFIGDNCPAYVLGFKLSLKEAIELIKNTGGIPVLAHPHTLGSDDVISEVINFGIMGLEVYYPEHSPSVVESYLNLATRHNLLITGGSDCHGDAKPEVKIGSVKIDYDLVKKLKEAKENLDGKPKQ